MTASVPREFEQTERLRAGQRSTAGERVMARLDELATFSSDPDGLTRLYLTAEHKAAAFRVMAWMREAGMVAVLDAAGTVVGRRAGTGSRTLIIGSHIDTVRNAGRYDGTLGVLVAIEAVAAVDALGISLPFTVEVVAFGDEEGVRFPATLTGSRALAGTFDPASLEALDESGITLRDALVAFGSDPALIATLARSREAIAGYLEVHIEQGPVLEAEGLPVGIVTAINGASRLAVEVTGWAGHAGTVPMRLRRDAFTAAAEMALAVERMAAEHAGFVATVGRVDVRPGAVNVVPGQVTFTVDVRSSDDHLRGTVVEALRDRFAAIATGRSVTVSSRVTYDEQAAPCAPWLQDRLAAAVAELGIRPFRLASGAGHDGLAIAALCPIGMLFVRCAGGISHNPAEATTTEDAHVAVSALVGFIRNFRDPIEA